MREEDEGNWEIGEASGGNKGINKDESGKRHYKASGKS